MNVLKEALLEATTGAVNGQKAQLDIKKHGSGMMMLVKVLVRSRNYGRNGNREKQLRNSI